MSDETKCTRCNGIANDPILGADNTVYCGSRCMPTEPPPKDFEETVTKEALQAQNERLLADISRLEVQLAGCGVAALGYAVGENDARPGDFGWSPSFDDVRTLYTKCRRNELLLKEAKAALAASVKAHCVGIGACDLESCRIAKEALFRLNGGLEA